MLGKKTAIDQSWWEKTLGRGWDSRSVFFVPGGVVKQQGVCVYILAWMEGCQASGCCLKSQGTGHQVRRQISVQQEKFVFMSDGVYSLSTHLYRFSAAVRTHWVSVKVLVSFPCSTLVRQKTRCEKEVSGEKMCGHTPLSASHCL